MADKENKCRGCGKLMGYGEASEEFEDGFCIACADKQYEENKNKELLKPFMKPIWYAYAYDNWEEKLLIDEEFDSLSKARAAISELDEFTSDDDGKPKLQDDESDVEWSIEKGEEIDEKKLIEFIKKNTIGR